MLTSVHLALGPEWMNPETLLTNLGGVALWAGALIVFAECGLDFNRWYPWHRRMAGTVRFMATHRRERAHLRRSLDTVGP